MNDYHQRQKENMNAWLNTRLGKSPLNNSPIPNSRVARYHENDIIDAEFILIKDNQKELEKK